MTEFKKLMLGKLNRILYKLDTIENKLEIFQEKIQYQNQSSIIQEENIQFPICTLSELTLFEEQLQEMKFKEDVVCI